MGSEMCIRDSYSVMAKVGERLRIGAVEHDNFHFRGLRWTTVCPSRGPFEIHIDGDEYIQCLEKMTIPSGSNTQPLDPADTTCFRSVVGSFGWAAGELRPDIAFEASLLTQKYQTPTIYDAKRANAVIDYVKKHRVVLRIRPGARSLTVYHDGSLANLEDSGSQGGRLYCLTDSTGHWVSSFPHWESRKIKRVCHSSATAEVLSSVDAQDGSEWISQMWFEMTGTRLLVRLVTDNDSLIKKITTTKLPVEKRVRVDLAGLREGLRRGEFVMTWVASRSELADALTKTNPHTIQISFSDKRPLLAALATNCTHLATIPSVTKTRGDVCNF